MYVNDRFVSMFGYSRAEAVGQTAIGLGLYAVPAQREQLLRLLDVPGPQELEAIARTKSGEHLDLLLWIGRVPVLGEECMLAIACDITARKRPLRKSAHDDRLLRLVPGHAPRRWAAAARA